MKETVGFIGLGGMGLAMAANLLKAGFGLRVYNRTSEKARPLLEQGARLARRPAGEIRCRNPVSVHQREKPGVGRNPVSEKSGVGSSFLPERMKRHRITPRERMKRHRITPERMKRHRITPRERMKRHRITPRSQSRSSRRSFWPGWSPP